MPYGTVTPDTRSVLTPTQLAWCEKGDQWRVDVIYEGALDESFNVDTFEHAHEVADALAIDLLGGTADDWEVSLYDELDEPPTRLRRWYEVRSESADIG